MRLGWHPFLRIKAGGTFRPLPGTRFQPLRTLVPRPGTRWQGPGTAFVKYPSRLACTLLACWEAGYPEPWFILTDLPPESSDAPTAHSPPMPSAARKRKIIRCHHVCAKNESPVNAA